MLLQELHDMSGDVLCLQEVQADHYEKELKPWLSDQGYDGLFKQKTRESMGQHGKVDGCAIFWKRSKFLLVENYTIEFNECARRSAASLHMDSEESHRFMQRLSRDNVAQLVVLELFQRTATRARHHGSQICVVNTHLYSNHQRPDVKIWQCLTLLREIEHFVVQRDLPLLICGDFNSEPDSAVYQLLADRCVMGNHPELDGHPISVLPEVHQISHNLDLASVYGTALGQEPLYTNYTGSFRGTLDYIWFTPAKLRVLTIAAIPEVDILETAGEALPNPQYPSDHLSMCCDVQLAASGPVVRPGTRKVPSLHASPASKAKHRR
jgi:CCR4-NOT transcription complex subunit 6